MEFPVAFVGGRLFVPTLEDARQLSPYRSFKKVSYWARVP